MMTTLTTAAKVAAPVAAILGCFISAASAMGLVDGWIVSHLSTSFATKQDMTELRDHMDKMDAKIDGLLAVMLRKR